MYYIRRSFFLLLSFTLSLSHACGFLFLFLLFWLFFVQSLRLNTIFLLNVCFFSLSLFLSFTRMRAFKVNGYFFFLFSSAIIVSHNIFGRSFKFFDTIPITSAFFLSFYFLVPSFLRILHFVSFNFAYYCVFLGDSFVLTGKHELFVAFNIIIHDVGCVFMWINPSELSSKWFPWISFRRLLFLILVPWYTFRIWFALFYCTPFNQRLFCHIHNFILTIID